MTAGIWNIELEQGATWNPSITWMSYRRTADDASITLSDATLTCTNGDFSAADVGKSISVYGAGSNRGTLTTTISSVTSSTEVELAASATFTVTDATIEIFVPVNLTSFTARMSIRDRKYTELLSLTNGNSKITLGGTAGTISFLITATESAALPYGIHSYDLELVSGSSVVTKLLKGSFSVLRERTT